MKPGPDMWNERYGAEAYAYGLDANDFLRAMRPNLTEGPVLCLAAGEGRNAVYLASAGLGPVTAVDASTEGIAKTRRLAAHREVSVDAVVGDLATWELGEARYQTVTSIFAHMPTAIRIPLHRRVVAALRPGGVLILEAYTPAQVGRGTGGPPVAALMMTLDSLREELDRLEIVIGREVEREVHEGQFHHGLSSVVQVLARKPSSS